MVVQSHTGVSFNNKKGWRTDTCFPGNEPWKHSVMQRKVDMKGHMLCNPISMKCAEPANPLEGKQIHGCQGLGGRGPGSVCSLDDKMFWNKAVMVFAQYCEHRECPWIAQVEVANVLYYAYVITMKRENLKDFWNHIVSEQKGAMNNCAVTVSLLLKKMTCQNGSFQF